MRLQEYLILIFVVVGEALLQKSPLKNKLLSLSLLELSDVLCGSGKAKLFWEMICDGHDPLDNNSLLSTKAKLHLESLLLNNGNGKVISTIPQEETISDCGGRKILHRCYDGMEVESVIIPHQILPRTTLCVSSQIGCDRGCIFCATGKMGLIRNLSADEILAQLYWAKRTVRENNLNPLKNVVFMGMGDIGGNLDSVGEAVHAMVDNQRFKMSPRKITLSTVGPKPETFSIIADLPGTIAWSLHSAIPELRKKLVPSSRYHDPQELRDALIEALMTKKSEKQRSVMIAITLMEGVNNAVNDAVEVAKFLKPFVDFRIKVNVDLIPYNDIGMDGLIRPSDTSIVMFKDVLAKAGFLPSVRLTRGEENASACGMLATKRKQKSDLFSDHDPFPLSL